MNDIGQEIKIRLGRQGDENGIARVHVDTWRTTYAGIIPADFLANLSYERRAQMWANMISNSPPGYFLFVAEMDGTIVGFVDGGPAREGPAGFSAEIYGFYLLKEQQGKGWGRALFERAVENLKAAGHKSMFLWVLTENPARGFYERIGGNQIAEKDIEIGGAILREVAYGWPEIDGSD